MEIKTPVFSDSGEFPLLSYGGLFRPSFRDILREVEIRAFRLKN